MRVEDRIKIIENAKEEALDSLCYAHKNKLDIEYIRDLSALYSSLCWRYYNYKNEKLNDIIKTIRVVI